MTEAAFRSTSGTTHQPRRNEESGSCCGGDTSGPAQGAMTTVVVVVVLRWRFFFLALGLSAFSEVSWTVVGRYVGWTDAPVAQGLPGGDTDDRATETGRDDQGADEASGRQMAGVVGAAPVLQDLSSLSRVQESARPRFVQLIMSS